MQAMNKQSSSSHCNKKVKGGKDGAEPRREREVEQRVWCDGTGGKELWESEQRKGGFSGNHWLLADSKKKRNASFGQKEYY